MAGRNRRNNKRNNRTFRREERSPIPIAPAPMVCAFPPPAMPFAALSAIPNIPQSPLPIAPAPMVCAFPPPAMLFAALSAIPNIPQSPLPIAPAPMVYTFQHPSVSLASSVIPYTPPFDPIFVWQNPRTAFPMLTSLRLPNEFCSGGLYLLSECLSAEFFAKEIFGSFKQQMFRYSEEKRCLPGFNLSADMLLPQLLEKAHAENYDFLLIYDLCVAELFIAADLSKEQIEQRLLPYFQRLPLAQFEDFNTRRLTRNDSDNIYQAYKLFLANNVTWVVACIMLGSNTHPEREWLMRSMDLLSVALLPEERLFSLLDRAVHIDFSGKSRIDIEIAHVKFFVGLDVISGQTTTTSGVSSFASSGPLTPLNLPCNGTMATKEILADVNTNATAFQPMQAEKMTGLLKFLDCMHPAKGELSQAATLPQPDNSELMQLGESRPSRPVTPSLAFTSNMPEAARDILIIGSTKRSVDGLGDSGDVKRSCPRHKRSAESPISVDIFSDKPRSESSDLSAFMKKLKTAPIDKSFFISSNDRKKVVRYIPFFDNPLVFEEEQKKIVALFAKKIIEQCLSMGPLLLWQGFGPRGEEVVRSIATKLQMVTLEFLPAGIWMKERLKQYSAGGTMQAQGLASEPLVGSATNLDAWIVLSKAVLEEYKEQSITVVLGPCRSKANVYHTHELPILIRRGLTVTTIEVGMRDMVPISESGDQGAFTCTYFEKGRQTTMYTVEPRREPQPRPPDLALPVPVSQGFNFRFFSQQQQPSAASASSGLTPDAFDDIKSIFGRFL